MKYRVIYADPPWRFRNQNTGGSMRSGASAHYRTMSVPEICAVPVYSMAEDDSLLCMWWVGAQPDAALAVTKAWGFELVTMTGFVWHKLTRRGLPFFGCGFWTRAGAECCLIAKRGRIKRVDASVRSVIIAKVAKHSAKPPEVRDRIVQLCGDVPRIELFAREREDGWEAWGDEV